MNEFRICDKCKGTNVSTLEKKLKELDPSANIKIGCQNMCGIGAKKPFAIVNHIPIVAEDENELIEKVKQAIH